MAARGISWVIVLVLLVGCVDSSTPTPTAVSTARPTVDTPKATPPVSSPQPIDISPPFDCPVTKPNGSRPPGETAISAGYYGNGALWTVLPADGILYVRRENDGRLSTKLPWWRGVRGTLTIEGQRLDGAGEFSAHIPDGYGSSGFQATGVYFSDEGCWELRGRAGSAELKFVVNVKDSE
jgi:hypothetical protein